eukprot:6482179-Amphidinium_carterae.1
MLRITTLNFLDPARGLHTTWHVSCRQDSVLLRLGLDDPDLNIYQAPKHYRVSEAREDATGSSTLQRECFTVITMFEHSHEARAAG